MDTDTVLVRVTAAKLQLAECIEFVQHDGAGAIATFSGVTRNVFSGKKVIHLEYEAYKDMAEKILKVRKPKADDYFDWLGFASHSLAACFVILPGNASR